MQFVIDWIIYTVPTSFQILSSAAFMFALFRKQFVQTRKIMIPSGIFSNNFKLSFSHLGWMWMCQSLLISFGHVTILEFQWAGTWILNISATYFNAIMLMVACSVVTTILVSWEQNTFNVEKIGREGRGIHHNFSAF